MLEVASLEGSAPNSALGADAQQPLVVGLGGGLGATSSTERALALALEATAAEGARTKLLGGEVLGSLPLYMTPGAASSESAEALVSAIREADGVIIASPSYHGSISGAVKNAIDYLEGTARDERPYLTDLPVGLIAIAGGDQGAASTLSGMRSIVHALRGCPTPFGAAIRAAGKLFVDGACQDEAARTQLELVGGQTARLARRLKAARLYA